MRPRIRRTQPEVEILAVAHRKEPTRAEALLWEAVRSGRLNGLKFRRQHPVGRFILDFYCPAHKLVIEVDGPIHETQAYRDEERTRTLQAHGYHVLRFSNDQIEQNIEVVLAFINEATL